MTNKISAPSVKKTNEKFLFLQLSLIERWGRGDLRRKDVAKRLGAYSSWKAPKQALTYHLNKLTEEGLIRKVQSYPYSIYDLTSKGQRIKKILLPSQKRRSLWRCHALIIGFEVKDLGSFNFVNTSRRKIARMNNWRYAIEKIGDYTINIHTTGLIKMYCPVLYHTDPDQAFAEMYSNAQRIAQEYCDKYDMKLFPMRIIRKGHKALVKSESLAKMMGKFSIKSDKIDAWVDESEGMEVEERQDSYAVEDLLKMPERFATFTTNIDRYNKNIEMHLEVMEAMKVSLQQMTDVLTRIEQGVK